MKTHPYLSAIALLLVLIGASIALIAITNNCILTVDFYERSEQPVSGNPEMAIMVYQNIRRTIYLYAGLYLVIKVVTISFILYTALYFAETEVSFAKILQVVISAEFIFMIPAAMKIWIFWQQRTSITLDQWQQYYFLSIASVAAHPKPVFLYSLQVLNVFEVFYWVLLAAGIEKVAKLSLAGASRIVCFSYLPALFVWIIAVAFFTITFFPQSY